MHKVSYLHTVYNAQLPLRILMSTRVFVSASYVRNMHNGKTCVEAGYEDITSRSQCESAFRSHPEHPKKESSSSFVSWCHYTPMILAVQFIDVIRLSCFASRVVDLCCVSMSAECVIYQFMGRLHEQMF